MMKLTNLDYLLTIIIFSEVIVYSKAELPKLSISIYDRFEKEANLKLKDFCPIEKVGFKAIAFLPMTENSAQYAFSFKAKNENSNKFESICDVDLANPCIENFELECFCIKTDSSYQFILIARVHDLSDKTEIQAVIKKHGIGDVAESANWPIWKRKGNPCEKREPFLCKSSSQCITIKYICDGFPDCKDGFDEDPELCNAASRIGKDDLMVFLNRERKWIIHQLFDGASIDRIAHVLIVASGLNDLRASLGLTDKNVKLLETVFVSSIEGDERPLIAMGMPESSWHEVKYVFLNLYDSGFKVDMMSPEIKAIQRYIHIFRHI